MGRIRGGECTVANLDRDLENRLFNGQSKTSYLRKVRCTSKIQKPDIVIYRMPVEPSNEEKSSICEDADVVAPSRRWSSKSWLWFELKSHWRRCQVVRMRRRRRAAPRLKRSSS